MVKDDGSPSKASSKLKAKKAKDKKGSGLSTLSVDAPSDGGANIAAAVSDPISGGNPPTNASELKGLLRKSLDEEAKRIHDGVANAAPNAKSESPLLVRTDTTTPLASPKKPKEAKRKNSEKTKRKKTRKEFVKETKSVPMQSRLSTISTPRDNDNNNSSTSNSQISNVRISGPRLNLSLGSCFGKNRSLVSCMPWGAGRLILAMGTLRTSSSGQSPPPHRLSSIAQAQVEALAPIAKKCWVELFVERCDELPFGVYSKPQVQVHLVDRFTGKPMLPMGTTSHAKLNYACSYANAFKWYQSLRFPIMLVDFLSPRSLLLFEIFEIPTAEKKTTKNVRTKQYNGVRFEQVGEEEEEPSTRSESDGRRRQPRHRIAWAFYSPVSEKGNVMLRNLSPFDDSDLQQQDTDSGGSGSGGAQAENGSIRLQLYEYQIMTWMDQFQAKSQWEWTPSGSSHASAANACATVSVPAVYLQYQKRRRAVVPSTVYIDIRPIIPPVVVAGENTTATSHSQSFTQEDNNTEPVGDHDPDDETKNRPSEVDTNQELQQTSPVSPSTNITPSQITNRDSQQMSTIDPLIVCKRSPTESCLVPHRVLCRLSTGKKGCSCVAFSPCGLFLAAAINPDCGGDFLVYVYHVNSSQVVQIGRGHRAMIYTLEWDQSTQYLISASSDGTARLWRLMMANGSPGSCTSIWQHSPSPCFVYCGIFHPVSAQQHFAITGASNGLVRFWRTPSQSRTANSPTGSQDGELGRLRVSQAAVHSIRIEPKSGRLFCGDAQGTLTVWKPTSSSSSSLSIPCYELVKTIHTGQTAVTSMQLHPRKQHLLVHTQPSAILQYELRSYLLLNKNYTGVVCEKTMGKSAFSPDGRFVVSGSENGVPLLFASVQGQKFQRGIWGKPFFHQYPVVDISWSPAAHIVALCSYGGNHPIVLLCAHRTDEDLARHLLVADFSRAAAASSSSSSAFTRELAQERAAGAVGSDGGDGTRSVGDDHSERVKRALERRRQRLLAKVDTGGVRAARTKDFVFSNVHVLCACCQLALETESTAEATAHASI